MDLLGYILPTQYIFFRANSSNINPISSPPQKNKIDGKIIFMQPCIPRRYILQSILGLHRSFPGMYLEDGLPGRT